jgi:biotin transport system substrate-specific component
MSLIALFAALMCILAPISIPVGSVPITFANLVVFLSVLLLGTKDGTLSCLVYILIGVLGLPVFSNFTSGLGVVLGPTGGYIFGYILTCLVSGIFVENCKNKKIKIIGLILGLFVSYLVGTLWYSYITKMDFFVSLLVCVIPFVIIDIVKITIAILLSDMIVKRLNNETM